MLFYTNVYYRSTQVVHYNVNLLLARRLSRKSNAIRKFRYYCNNCIRLSSSGEKTSNVNLSKLNVPSSFALTTPIFYVNSVPHIGHLYTAVLADAISRWYRILGTNVSFSTGTDEHGLKIQQAASTAGINPQKFCDTISSKFKYLFAQSDIAYTDYIRTTEARHIEAVHHMWKELEKRGYIYKGSYSGWYSVPDETFLSEADVEDAVDNLGVKIKISKESGHKVEWTSEENYMFRLSAMGPKLLTWLNKRVIRPTIFSRPIIQWVEAGLPDLSISRERSRLEWGIPVPGDENHTVYVWLDALVNYLTVAGYPHDTTWPTDLHIVGKDILRFHAVYWPAFLIAAGLEPPRGILCHSHWMIEHAKMSKSKGNVVEPCERIEKYTPDGMRYFLLREGVPHSDGNYSDQKVIDILNSELCNTLGNLLQRCTAKSLNPLQQVPNFQKEVFLQHASLEDTQMWLDLHHLPGIVDEHYREFNIYKALDIIMHQLRKTNGFIQNHKPWELKKDSELSEHLENVLYVAMETLRISSILLQPVVPNLAGKILNRLGVNSDKLKWSDLELSLKNSGKLGPDTGPLFLRIK